MTDAFALNARRLKIAQILEAQSRDETRMARLEKVHAQCAEQDISGRALLAQFQESADVVWLKDELGTWGRQPGYFPYNGVNGQMFLNQNEIYYLSKGDKTRSLLWLEEKEPG